MLEAGISQQQVECPTALFQGCGNSFELTEMSGMGMVVVVRGLQLGVETDLLSSKGDASALLRLPPGKIVGSYPPKKHWETYAVREGDAKQ